MQPDIEEKVIGEEDALASPAKGEGATPVSPVQFFDHGDGYGIDRDFRPVPVDDVAPREDGHGNRYLHPQNDGMNVLNPGEAWDPHVVPYRNRTAQERAEAVPPPPPMRDDVRDDVPPDEPLPEPAVPPVAVESTPGVHPSEAGAPPPFMLGQPVTPTPTAQEAEPAQE